MYWEAFQFINTFLALPGLEKYMMFDQAVYNLLIE